MRPLRAVLALQCLHLAAAQYRWKFHEYAKHDTACAPRYINVGMPKSGSSSVSEFYRCHGMTTAHWHNSPRDAAGHKTQITPGFPGNLVGDETHACDVQGKALLECGPCVDMYGQMDAVLLDRCWVPREARRVRVAFLGTTTPCKFLPSRYISAISARCRVWCGTPSTGAAVMAGPSISRIKKITFFAPQYVSH